ncbi:lipopolysaccharide kinase InaA family protein [Algibacter sp. Ld11]|uniref:lipopolysaccharide kinase InaA family protein n=1 Tax=Algibacter sp. Ld11 TaxID=649150 RepID=UPI0038701080
MKEVKVFNKNVESAFRVKLEKLVDNFDAIAGGEGERNTIKISKIDNVALNIKSFKVPNIINQVVYSFFRKSKAQRSFEYAEKLMELQVGTPKPLAYFEYKTPLLFKNSFYISEQLDCDLTYRELIHDFNYPDYDNILRAFTRFTFNLHEKGVHFLDHSPGNTLIKKKGDGYDFYLVDLNRMNFGELDFETRMKNFARLTKYKQMVEVMSDEYAKCIAKDYDTVFNAMWKEVETFRAKFTRKKALKKKLKL